MSLPGTARHHPGAPAALYAIAAATITLIRVVDALHDLLLLCGCYHAISFAARAVRVEPEPGAPRFADVVAA
jgi:hypothetical protein